MRTIVHRAVALAGGDSQSLMFWAAWRYIDIDGRDVEVLLVVDAGVLHSVGDAITIAPDPQVGSCAVTKPRSAIFARVPSSSAGVMFAIMRQRG